VKKYLLDTNICIYYFKGKFNLREKFEKIDPENCFISEITLAELKFGVENSQKKEKNQKVLNHFLGAVQIVPIFHALDLYAAEKARLRKSGIVVDDFDLLIGTTAVAHNLVMVTNNSNHFNRINGIQLEDWTNQNQIG
jgi:tRNA(fMet)-specific endonuclease VapC